ncbi:MAG: hypothetical protein AB1486_03595 [Planctomycetota bacterium]
MAVRAWAPLSEAEKFAGVRTKDKTRGPQVDLGTSPVILEVQEFQRPPVLWAVTWPACPVEYLIEPRIEIAARYPAGAAAAGLEGMIKVEACGFQHTTPSVLDNEGKVSLTIATRELDLPAENVTIACQVAVTAAHGQTLHEDHTLVLDATPVSTSRPQKPHPFEDESQSASIPAKPAALRIDWPARLWRAGEEIPITLTGPAGAPPLLSIGRASLLEVRVITLDECGVAKVAVRTKREWCPSVCVAVDAPHALTSSESPPSCRTACSGP